MAYHYSKKTLISAAIFEIIFGGFFKILRFFFKNRHREEQKRILIVEPFQMGDVISLSVLLNPLRKKFPSSEIFIFTQEKNWNVFKGDSRVKEIIIAPIIWGEYKKNYFNIVKWKQFISCILRMSSLKFEIGIDTRGDIRNHLILTLASCSQRIGYTNYLGSNFSLRGWMLDVNLGNAPILHRYEVNLWVFNQWLKQNETVEIPSICFENIPPIKYEPPLPQIVIHIGGGWEYKQWNVENWIELLNRLAPIFKGTLVLIGGPQEEENVKFVSQNLSENHYVAITSYEQMIGILKGSQLFIGLDSGPMNLAVSLGLKVLALFGPGDSQMWYPYGSEQKYIHKKEQYPCNPCLQKKCMFPQNSCMSAIQVQEVFETVQTMIPLEEIHNHAKF